MRFSYPHGLKYVLVGLLFYGSAILAQSPSPASSTPGQAIPGTLGVSPFSGSTPARLVPGVLPLSLQEAIDRGLKQNLGLLLSDASIRSARGQRWEQLSALLPHVTAAPYVGDSQINLAELGFSRNLSQLGRRGVKFVRAASCELFLRGVAG